MNRYKWFDRAFKLNVYWVTILCGVGYLFLLLIFDRETYIYGSQYSVLNGGGWHQALVNFQRLITGIFGSFFILGIIKIVHKKIPPKTTEMLKYFGMNTLQLYVISTFFVFSSIELRFATKNVSYILAIISFIIVTGLSVLTVEIMKKNKITNLLFFGKKIIENNLNN